MTLEVVGLLFLGALAWLWYDSINVRDLGIRAAQAACRAEDLQLLDETVAITGVGLGRDDDGRLRLRRTYAFDYSDTGDNRRRGSLVMLGARVQVINTGPQRADPPSTLH